MTGRIKTEWEKKMKFTQSVRLIAIFAILALLLPALASAQSVVTGGINGTVSDASGAVIVGANVSLKNVLTNETSSTTSNGSGIYTFSLLKPGDYTLTITRQGFKTVTENVTVVLGQVVPNNVTLEVGSGSTTVEVTEHGQLLQTENANISTNFDTKQINEVPNPGGDVTYLANSAPGIVANNSTGGGFGNFSAFGLPADANLFTVNGNDYNDPFLNLNNTGSSNLLLGGNELQEIAIVANGYTGQYGRQAGAQVDYTTKSGGNAFHGDAVYYWTGRELTANDPINKFGERAGGQPNTRPFENNNQWAASLGGPIKKDKAFFFLNTEGIRYILAGTKNVTLMTPDFQNYVNSQIPTDQATQAFYTNVFSLYNAAPGISKAVRNTNLTQNAPPEGSCKNFTIGAAGTANAGKIVDPITGLALPAALQDGGCTESFTQAVTNGNKEWLLAARVDYSFSDTDKIFGRFKTDHGLQPTYTDAINPAFNDSSNQPQDDGQLNYTHVFSPTVVNNFIGSVYWYSAIFGNTNPAAALGLFPGNLVFVDGSGTTALGSGAGSGGLASGFEFPQGRNVTQWQLIDDVAVTRGSHSFKMGLNYRRDDVSDYSASQLTQYPGVFTSLINFAHDQVSTTNGPGNVLFNFALHSRQPIAFYSFGLYFQDEWRASSKLKFTMTLRADRNSGGACQSNCGTLPVTPFDSLPHGADIPYDAAFPGGSFQTGRHSILPNVEKVVFEPRFGFAWTPLGQNTVFRGGIGLFTDLYPGTILGNYTTNFPQVNAFNASAGTLAFDLNPAASTAFPTSGVGIVQQCNSVFATNFNNGGNLNTYATAASTVTGGCVGNNGNLIVPNLFDTESVVKNPKYVEWNFEVQHTFGANTVLSVNYVGNRGYDEFIQNGYLNAFCDPVICGAPVLKGTPGVGFVNSGLPTAPLDPRVGNVLQLTNAGYSNYNGVTASIQENNWHGLSGRLNYTYSHSLDATSNGGISPFSGINSFINQINPFNPRLGYSSSDNDVRHNLSANYVYGLPFKSENRLVNYAIGGWQISGTFFWHTGFPFSVFDGAQLGAFQQDNLQFAAILAQPLFATRSFTNGNPCLVAFISGATCFGSGSNNTFAASTNFTGSVVGRNAFVGPGFFSADFSIRKSFQLNERFNFQIGLNAYNAFNHLNYGTAAANTNGAIAPIGTGPFTASQPTSPYGAFSAASVDQRIAQIQGKITF
jgi:hypothetical protein